MPFSSGSMSFQRYAVVGNHATSPDEKTLADLAENRLQETDLGVPEPVETGWCGGRHVLDGQFAFGHNVYDDAMLFAMRVDTNRVPADLKRAYTLMEIDAAASQNPSGFASKSQKRDAKDAVGRKLDDELRSGRFRRSRMVPILWDVPKRVLYGPTSPTAFGQLLELFDRTFALDLIPLTSGQIALRTLENRGKRREFEDLRPTRFVPGPEGESQAAEYGWAPDAGRKDFLGNEFALWLWHLAETTGGGVPLKSGTGPDEAAIFFDKSLDLDCVFGQTGRDTLRGDGVTRMPEARDALRSGKVPRKTGLIVSAGDEYAFTLQAETLAVSGLRLPQPEDAEQERAVIEHRVSQLRTFSNLLDGLFEAFLSVRTGGAWEARVNDVRSWITATAPRPARAA